MKQATRPIFCLLSIVVLFSGSVHARSWRVERDGSGDYTAIQPALDAAAEGDTLLLGPGRFTETHVVEAPYDTGDVYLEVSTDSITIIGSGIDATIIGSVDADKRSDHWPKGILGWIGVSNLRLEHLTIENMRDGIYWQSGISINHCSLSNNVEAVMLWPYDEPVSVIDASFSGNTEDSIISWGPCREFVVMDCVFSGPYCGVVTMGMDSVLVSGCSFTGHRVSVQYDSCQGEIRNCNFVDGVAADVVSIGSHLQVNDCRFSSAYRAIFANTWGYLVGTGNIIPPGAGERILIGGTSFYFNGNHILRGDGPAIKLGGYIDPPAEVLDFTGNYWGTTEADSIAAWIWDENDDSHVQGEVVFEPFSPVPLPDEKKSLGDVKRMFR